MNFVCSVDGCVRDSRANGMCDTHDRQFKRTGTTSPIRPRREPKPATPVRCGGCGQIVGIATSETTAQTVLRNHRCQPAPTAGRERKPATPAPLKAVPDKPARPHPSKLVDHPSRRVARAAQRVMDAVAKLDEAWSDDAAKAELRAERDRLKEQLAAVEQRLRGQDDLGVRRDWHEPDEQEVTAHMVGGSVFDNAMSPGTEGVEMCVLVCQDGVGRAVVNLASLFAMACGEEF